MSSFLFASHPAPVSSAVFQEHCSPVRASYFMSFYERHITPWHQGKFLGWKRDWVFPSFSSALAWPPEKTGPETFGLLFLGETKMRIFNSCCCCCVIEDMSKTSNCHWLIDGWWQTCQLCLLYSLLYEEHCDRLQYVPCMVEDLLFWHLFVMASPGPPVLGVSGLIKISMAQIAFSISPLHPTDVLQIDWHLLSAGHYWVHGGARHSGFRGGLRLSYLILLPTLASKLAMASAPDFL